MDRFEELKKKVGAEIAGIRVSVEAIIPSFEVRKDENGVEIVLNSGLSGEEQRRWLIAGLVIGNRPASK